MLDVRCTAGMGSLNIDAAFTATRPWTVLFGPSGSGKSSVFRLIAGVWQPQVERVMVDGDDVSRVPAYRRNIALVAQQPALFPHLSVRQNVAFAVKGGHGSRDSQLANDLLIRLHVSHVATQMPRELSGGEMKRVAVARALAMQPRLLLLDEVFTGMEADLALSLRAELRSWQTQTGVPILSVTHDIAEALEADEVIRIDVGRITVQGAPHTVLYEERTRLLQALTSQEMR